MFLKAGKEKGAAGNAAELRRGDQRCVGQRQVGGSAAKTLPIPQHKVQPGGGDFLDQGAQPLIIGRPQGAVLGHNADIQADRVGGGQLMAQAALGQSAGIQRAHRQRRYRRQNAEPGHGQ